MKAHLIMVAVVMAVGGESFAETESARKNALGKTAVKNRASEWQPTPYDPFVDRLPKNYIGVDSKRFFDLFASRLSANKRGEFETSSEFAKRTEDKNALLFPIRTDVTYAFKTQYLETKYDPDHEKMIIGGSDTGFGCNARGLKPSDQDFLTCQVGTDLKFSSYVGSNAFGVTKRVSSTAGKVLSVAISKFDVPRPIFRDYGDFFGYVLEDELPMPIEKARALKEKTIGALFVGVIAEPKIIVAPASYEKPTLSSPSDSSIDNVAIPFSLQKIVYYVIESGEIIAERSEDRTKLPYQWR